MVVVGYLGFVPAASFYFPVAEGLSDRVNAGAAYGYAMVVGGLAFGIGAVVACAANRPKWGVPIGALLGVSCSRGSSTARVKPTSIYRSGPDTRPGDVRHPLDRAGPAARESDPGGRLPVTTGPNIPSFALSNDLQGAVRLAYGRADLNAMPIRSGVPVTCGKDSVHVGDPTLPDFADFVTQGQYGRTILVNVRTGRRVTVRTRSQCETVRGEFPAGPDLASMTHLRRVTGRNAAKWCPDAAELTGPSVASAYAAAQAAAKTVWSGFARTPGPTPRHRYIARRERRHSHGACSIVRRVRAVPDPDALPTT